MTATRIRRNLPMIRSELIDLLAADHPELAPSDIARSVDVIFDLITEHLAADGRVELRGLGTFSTRPRKAWTGRNPRTGSAVDLPEKRLPRFKPSKLLHARLNR